MDRREFSQVAFGVILCRGQGRVAEETIFLPTEEVLKRLTAHVEKAVRKSDVRCIDGQWINTRECLDALRQPPPPIRSRVKQWSRSIRRSRFNGESAGEVVVTIRLDNDPAVHTIRVPIGADPEITRAGDGRMR